MAKPRSAPPLEDAARRPEAGVLEEAGPNLTCDLASCCFLDSYPSVYLRNDRKKRHETGCFQQGWLLIEGES